MNALLSRLLKEEGHRIYSAFDGEKTLVTVKEELLDLIVLDLILPEMDGYEFLDEVKKSWQA